MRLRALFEWSAVGIIAPAIIGVAGTVVGISLGSQIGPVLIGITGAWILVTVLLDEKIHRKGIALFAVVIVTGIAVSWTESVILAKELEAKEGDLVPSTLSNACGASGLCTIWSPGDLFWWISSIDAPVSAGGIYEPRCRSSGTR